MHKICTQIIFMDYIELLRKWFTKRKFSEHDVLQTIFFPTVMHLL